MAAIRATRPCTAASIGAAVLVAMLASPLAAQTTSSKSALAARALQLQMAGVVSIAQGLVERPAALMLQDARQALHKRIPEDKREAAGKQIQDIVKRYVDEATPLVQAQAVKLAPGVLGAELEARFSEDELSQLVAWLESPVSRKYQQLMPQIQDSFVQKLVAESRPMIDPKLLKLEQDVRATLGLPPAPAAKTPAKPEAAEAAPKIR